MFGSRLLLTPSIEAVKFGLSIQERTGKLFVWLCVANQGVPGVHPATILQFDPPITPADLESHGYKTDPNVGKDGKMVVRPGLTIRCTRNLSKERGFVNGAIAIICEALADYNPTEGRPECVFTARLSTGGYDLSASCCGR